MSEPLNWATDPVVLLECSIIPVLSAAPEALCLMALRTEQSRRDVNDPVVAEYMAAFPIAEQELRKGGAARLALHDVHLSARQTQVCQTGADSVAKLYRSLTDMAANTDVDADELAEISTRIRTQMRPAVMGALDAFREAFIGTVLERQVRSVDRADAAIRKLSQVSKKIFFISLNASVEAARVGDAGRGFAFISQEIRTLSQDAQATTENLIALMDRAN